MADPAGIPLINQLIEQFAIQSEAEQLALRGLDNIQKEVGSSVDTEVEAIRSEAIISGQIQRGVDNILITRAQRNKETAAMFGVNTEAHNSVVQALSQEIIAQHTDLQKSAKAIQVKQQQEFLDDPASWLVNQFTLPQDVAAHNTGVALMEGNVKALQQLGELADKQIARNNAIDANTTAELSLLSAERLKAAAEIRVQDARQKAAQLNINIGSVRLATSQQAFSNLVQLHNAQTSLQHLQLATANKDLNEVQKKLAQKNLELLIAAKEEDAASKAQLQLQLDRATSVLGMRRITVSEYKQAPQKTQSALFDVMANPNIKDGRLGFDAVDAVETANNLNAPLTPQTMAVKNIATNWIAEAYSRPEFAALKPEQKHVKAQEHVISKVKSEVRNIPDEGGLYSAPSLSAVGQIPAVANTILWKSTFAPMTSDKRRPTSAQAIYDAATSLVGTKKMDIERASAEIATIYKAIALDNTQNRDYNRFALPNQNSYNTNLQIGSGPIGGKRIIDMTNETAVRNAIMRTIAEQESEKTTRGLGIYN